MIRVRLAPHFDSFAWNDILAVVGFRKDDNPNNDELRSIVVMVEGGSGRTREFRLDPPGCKCGFGADSAEDVKYYPKGDDCSLTGKPRNMLFVTNTRSL